MDIYKRPRSKYWYVDLVVNGRRQRKSTKQTKRSAAQEAAVQMMQELHTPAPPSRPVMPTLQQYIEETFLPFLDRCTSLKPRSILSYRNGCRLLNNTTLTGADNTERPYTLTPLDQVCFSDVDTLKIPGGPSNTNNMRRSLSRILSHAVDKRILAAKPRIHLAKERKRTAVYSPELEQKVLAMAEQPLLDIFLLVFDGGVRPDESLHLRWSDLLWEKSLIHIEAGKTSRAERYVPMSERVREMLKERARSTKSEWVFPSPRKKGAPWTYGPIGRRYARVREAVGIPDDIVLYSGRHTFATDLLDSTGNIKLVADTLGHASVTTTARYLHPSKKGLAEHVNKRNAARAQEGVGTPLESRHTLRHTSVPVQ